MGRGSILLVLMAVVAPGASGDPPGLETEEVQAAADAILAAVRTKDPEKLRDLAGRPDPDPWLVADALLGRTEMAAAKIYAAAVPASTALRSYVASDRARKATPEDRLAISQARVALADQEVVRCLALVAKRPIAAPVPLSTARILAAEALSNARRFRESIGILREAGDAARRIGWSRRAAKGYQLGGRAALRAKEPAEELLALAEEQFRSSGDADGLASVRLDRARFLVVATRFDEARALVDEVLALARTGERPLIEIAALRARAEVEASERRPDVAIASLTRARELAVECEESRLEWWILADAARIRTECGEPERALALLEEALDVANRLEDSDLSAKNLLELARCQFRRENLGRALDLFERCLERGEHSIELVLVASARLGMAQVQGRLGEFETAHRMLDLALSALRKIGNSRGELSAQLQKVVLFQREGLLEETADTLRKIARVAESDGDVLNHANALSALAHATRGHVPKAETIRLYRSAIAKWETLGHAERIVGDRNALGVFLADDHEEYTKAIREYRLALEASETRGLPLLEARTRWFLGESLLELDRPELALGEFLRALDLLEMTFDSLMMEQAAGVREPWYWLYASGIAAALEVGRIEEAYRFLESLRARTLLEAMRRGRRMENRAVPEALRRELAEARRREAVAESRRRAALGTESAKERKEEVDNARLHVTEVVARLRRRTPLAADLTLPEHVPLSDLRASLRAEDALVLYGVGSEQAIAMVVTRTDQRVVRLGSRERLMRLCDAIVDAVVTQAGGRGVRVPGGRDTGDARWKAIQRLARARLLDPLDLPRGTRRLIVVPHRFLYQIPFGFVASHLEVVNAPSCSTFAHLRRGAGSPGRGVLAVGDPHLGSRVAIHAGLNPLPSAADEARAIGDVVMVGRAASETRFRQHLDGKKRWRALHLACHGVVQTDDPLYSALILSGDESHDGLLFVLDVLDLGVWADLVALSACDSGRGDTYVVEGLVGFPRAFLAGGAERVLVSLCKVDDAATRALMERFYEHWNPEKGAGTTAGEALRRAQQHVRSQPGWEHPRFWAPWVLWGPD